MTGLRVLLAGAPEVGVVEMTLDPGSAGPLLRIHRTHGEGFAVLAGRLTVQVGAEIVTAGPGDRLWVPRHTPHPLANLDAAPVRVLCVFAPGGFERRFQRTVAEPERAPRRPRRSSSTRPSGPRSSSDRR